MKKTFRSIMAIAIAAMTFTACEDVPAPYDVFADEQSNETPSVVAEGSGTQADPFNVAAVLEYVNTLGTAESADQVYVKGIVASITEIAQGNFGNATYTISDDGTSNNIFTVYRSKNLGNTNFTSADELAVGDEVVVVGKVVNYNGKTPEFVQNASYLYSRNGKTSAGGSDQPAGEVKKVTVAEFNAAAESTDVWYQLTGTVKNLKDGDLYGNFDLEDATGSVYVYGLLSEKGGAKKLFQELAAAKGIKEGSVITIIGNRGSYNDKIEVTNAYFVSIEGDNGGNTGGNDNPNPGGGDVVSGNTISYDFSAQGFENATAIEGITLSDGTTLTFAGGTNSNVPKYYNSGTAVRLYPGNSMTVTAKKTITAIELTCSANNAEGQVSAAPGTVEVNDMTVNIAAINAASTVVTNAHTGTGATSQLRIKTLKITYAE